MSLPNSGLDFGALNVGDTNTLHYALEQTSGAYQYQITMAGGRSLVGECGSISNREWHKRVFIAVHDERVSCAESQE